MLKTFAMFMFLSAGLQANNINSIPEEIKGVLKHWCEENGFDETMAEKYVAAVTENGKANTEKCQARALALVEFLAKNPEDFLQQPKPYLERALVLASNNFQEDGPSPITVKKNIKKIGSNCPDQIKVNLVNWSFADIGRPISKFLVPKKIKTKMFQMSLAYWAGMLNGAIATPCGPKLRPGLFEDFESSSPLNSPVPYAVPFTYSGGTAEAILALDPTNAKNQCMKLTSSKNGPGFGVYMDSHYAPRTFTGKTKLSIMFKTMQDLDVFIKLTEDSPANLGGERWINVAPIHLVGSKDWQSAEVPLQNMVRDFSREDFKTYSTSGNNKMDLEYIETFEIDVDKAPKEKVELLLDDIEFR